MSKDYTKFFNAMRIPRFIVTPLPEKTYCVEAANQLALDYFGVGEAQVIGKKIRSFMDIENALHFEQSFEVSTSKKRSVTIQSLPGVPGNVRVHSFYISPVLDDKGEVEYLDAIGQLDIADQSIVQRERDDAISLLTSIFEVSEIGIIVTDVNARIVRVNDSFIRTFGWSREELVNQNISSMLAPDEREAARINHQEHVHTATRSSGEMRIMRKDESIANALYTTATLELSQKRRFQVMTVMDITLRKQMEESLRKAKDQADAANRAKSVFLANMSHELRTPMNAIIGFSEMMIKETFGPLGHEKYKEYIGDVHSSARHLLSIINEVLDMSKIEAGRIEVDEGEVDIRALIESVIRMMDSRAFGQEIRLITQFAADLPNIKADQRLLRQVLINLINNAMKFSLPKTQVTVSTEIISDGSMQIKIADQGTGIPEDKIEQAMEPFGQVTSGAENATIEGTGLGLPLAKAMVDLHDGTLEITSKPGEGTNVFVTLPAYRILKRKQAKPL